MQAPCLAGAAMWGHYLLAAISASPDSMCSVSPLILHTDRMLPCNPAAPQEGANPADRRCAYLTVRVLPRLLLLLVQVHPRLLLMVEQQDQGGLEPSVKQEAEVAALPLRDHGGGLLVHPHPAAVDAQSGAPLPDLQRRLGLRNWQVASLVHPQHAATGLSDLQTGGREDGLLDSCCGACNRQMYGCCAYAEGCPAYRSAHPAGKRLTAWHAASRAKLGAATSEVQPSLMHGRVHHSWFCRQVAGKELSLTAAALPAAGRAWLLSMHRQVPATRSAQSAGTCLAMWLAASRVRGALEVQQHTEGPAAIVRRWRPCSHMQTGDRSALRVQA